MPRVHLPDGRIVNFPDSMAPEQITAAIEEMTATKAAAQAQAAPSTVERVMGAAGLGPVARFVKNNPAESGAIAAGLVTAPFTGGMGLLGTLASMGGASALGAGAGQALSGQTPDVGTMAAQGLVGAAGHGVGRLVAKGAQLAGRGLYRAAALPINKMTKYGDLIDEGLAGRVPVSKSGLAKAEGIKAERVGKKAAAIKGADDRVTFRAEGIAEDIEPHLRTHATKQARAAQGNPMAKFTAKLDEFKAANPSGTLTPSRLEEVKGTLDDQLGGAYKKLRMKEALTPKERLNLELSQGASRAQESVIPDYRDLNRGVMNAEGLRQMIGRRVNPGNSGGNQGLENALTMLGGLKALPARIAMMPPVLSRVGIGAHEVGKAAEPVAPGMLRALAALLTGEQEE